MGDAAYSVYFFIDDPTISGEVQIVTYSFEQSVGVDNFALRAYTLTGLDFNDPQDLIVFINDSPIGSSDLRQLPDDFVLYVEIKDELLA